MTVWLTRNYSFDIWRTALLPVTDIIRCSCVIPKHPQPPLPSTRRKLGGINRREVRGGVTSKMNFSDSAKSSILRWHNPSFASVNASPCANNNFTNSDCYKAGAAAEAAEGEGDRDWGIWQRTNVVPNGKLDDSLFLLRLSMVYRRTQIVVNKPHAQELFRSIK